MIKWKKLEKKDLNIIDKIVQRAIKRHPELNKFDLTMDISAAHINQKLRLNDFLKADSFNFFHDIFGIKNTINRTNGELLLHFLPRHTER